MCDLCFVDFLMLLLSVQTHVAKTVLVTGVKPFDSMTGCALSIIVYIIWKNCSFHVNKQ